jgi:hypothetical protein
MLEPAAEEGVPQTPVAGPALVMHPAIDNRLKPRSTLRTWQHRLGTLQRRQARDERQPRLVAEAVAQLPHVGRWKLRLLEVLSKGARLMALSPWAPSFVSQVLGPSITQLVPVRGPRLRSGEIWCQIRGHCPKEEFDLEVATCWAA